MVELLSESKDYIHLQLGKLGRLPPPLPLKIPDYPVAEANYVDAKGLPMTMEEKNAEVLKLREDLMLIDYEVEKVDSSAVVLRLLFTEPETISARESQTDVLWITLNLQEFQSKDGAVIPNRSQLKKDLPAQLDLETARMIE